MPVEASAMSRYTLTVYAADRRTQVFQEPVFDPSETPRVGDLVTAHLDDYATVVARVTGVQRVLRPIVDPPGAPRTPGLSTTHVAVTAMVER
jgi:hypothetical protein